MRQTGTDAKKGQKNETLREERRGYRKDLGYKQIPEGSRKFGAETLSKEVAEAASTRASILYRGLDPYTGLQNKKIVKINVDLDFLRRALFQCHENSEV